MGISPARSPDAVWSTGSRSTVSNARNIRVIGMRIFITHMNQKADLEKMQRIGEEAYNIEQVEKRQILDRLLAEYNDGRKKTLFCLAVNLLPLEELRIVFEDGDLEIPEKDRARQMENRLKEKSSAELKLRKK